MLYRERSDTKNVAEIPFRLIVDQALDLVQVIDANGIVTYASPSHLNVLGYDPCVFSGKPTHFLSDASHDDQFEIQVDKMMQSHNPFVCEMESKHRDGRAI